MKPTIQSLVEWCAATGSSCVVHQDGTIFTMTGEETGAGVQRTLDRLEWLAGHVDTTHTAEPAKGVTLNAAGYESLAAVLLRAFNQSANGKGANRHAQAGEPFDCQVILEGARRFGIGGPLFQAYKKAEEAQRLAYPAAVAELLGSIVYTAAAVILLDEKNSRAANDNHAAARVHG